MRAVPHDDPGHEHERPVDRGDRGRRRAAGARPRSPLLQPGPGHEARRGRRRHRHRSGHRRRRRRPRHRLGQDAGPLGRLARASSSTASTARSPSRRCACSRPASPHRGDRRGDPRGRFPARAVRAHGPDRDRRHVRRLERDLGGPRPAGPPPPLAAPGGAVAAGRLGRKSGEGFYEYAGGRRGAAANTVPSSRSPLDGEAIRERILLPIVDEAHRAAAEGVATSADIDVALKLGAAHPIGPFERAEEAGGRAAIARRLRELARDDASFAPSAALEGGA